MATLVDNNYRNMHARDVKTKGREAADEESVPFLGTAFLVQFLDVDIVSVWRLTHLDPVMQEYASRVAYCIPLLANSAICYDVAAQQTPEMQKEAGSMLCLELNRSCVDIFCSIWLVTHLCSAGPGQASRRARGPVAECFEIC